MKIKVLFTGLILSVLFLASCTKKEGPYREADIVKEGFSLKEEGIVSNVIYEKDLITVSVHDILSVWNKDVTPIIQVSEGATIYPPSGKTVKVQNTKLLYTVTAEDGAQKPYIIHFVPSIPPSFDFESWAVNDANKNKPYDYLTDNQWANGNPGVRIMIDNNKEFPTRRTKDSHSGVYGALLETQYGNPTRPGSLTHTPIFAGSLFRGEFSLNIINPVASAKFGQIHTQDLGKPVLFTGYYKYKAGKVYQNEIPEPVPGKVDECDIYAVMFKVTKGKDGLREFLTAQNVKTSDKIVATAFFEDWLEKGESSERENYTRFEIPFTYFEELDYDTYDYKLGIVFTSSRDGAFFKGAIGSQLLIDDVDIVCEKID